jgi:Fe-S cluster assembly ATP-binding protein
MSSLQIKDLHVSIGDKEIVRGLNLEIKKGEVHAVMGLNGSGKSTLAKAIAGHPDYTVTGSVLLDGEEMMGVEPDERSRKGLFLAFQYPNEIPGVSNANFIRAALQSRLGEGEELDAVEFYEQLYQKMDLLGIKREMTSRSVNEGFSGGEKKRNEILQLAILEPTLAILDEADSGLDIDALRIVANGVSRLRLPDNAVILVTHYQRLLNYITPDYVHVMDEGRIIKTGDKELALELERRGYDWVADEYQSRQAA